MRHATRFAGLCVLISLAGACGSGDPQEAAMKEMIQAMNDLADIMDTVKDEASAQAAVSKVKGVVDRLQALKKRVEGMKEPSPELAKKYAGELMGAAMRLQAAGTKVSNIPGAQAAFAEAMKAIQ